ncbi:restriction endonuclease subunit S [Sphingorhabdus sp.]|uniref:restriction endonuclease subunit S n=1 Tax=Sphingorhabdus sp. TaxID=1902408 RepID=UPI0035B20F65
MSNKVDTGTGEADGGQTLVPKARFPEFQDAWQRLPMNQVYRFKGNNPFSRDQLNYEQGDLKTIHYGDIHTKFSASFRASNELVPFINRGEYHSSLKEENWCSVGDIVFADASEDMNDIGKAIEIIDAGDVPLTAGMHTILARPELHEMAVGFGCYVFASRYVRQQIQREAQGAKVLGISPTRLGSIKLPIPIDVSEQRRIADCLSSLDDLILAEEERLAALGDYKKGLIQQLFPRPERVENGEKIPAETAPRLRFPEFQDAGEWVETTIGEIGSFYYGKSAPKWSLEESAPTPCVRYGELYTKFGPLITETYSRTNIAPENLKFSKGGEILVPRVGEKPDDFGRNCSLLTLSGVAIGEMISVFETNQNALFYTFYFRHIYRQFAKVVEGQNVKNLYYAELEPLKIYRPSLPEQAKIAECLLSFEQLVDASEVKVADLRRHKSGLMQQLFPSPVERGA